MPLPPPSYIPVSRIQPPPIRHDWDDWDPVERIGEQDENLEPILESLRPDALKGLVISCAEWILYRMAKRTDVQRLHDYLDAAWVRLSRGEPVDYWPETNINCEGPIRGPLGVAAASIWNAFQSTTEGDLSAVVVMLRLARMILPDPTPFDSWLRQVISRLRQSYPRSEVQTPPPIREVYDPAIVVDESNRALLAESVEAYVLSRTNEFLADPGDDDEEGEDDAS